VDAFLAIHEACHAIAVRYADSEAAVHAKAGAGTAAAR
jgi:hypothetical protein